MILLKNSNDEYLLTGAEVWLIVRKLDNNILQKENIVHMPNLSPSPELFKLYREAFHGNHFDENWFQVTYVPRFLKDLSQNEEANILLKYLCKKSHTKDFILECYCEVESLCHRSIVGGILLGMGANIDTKPEFIKYYDQYMKLQ